MSKYGIKIEIYTFNSGLINAVKNIVNNTSGEVVKLNDAPFEIEIDNIIDGVVVEIHFDNTNDRAGIVNDLRGLSGMIHACVKPSRIIGFDFKHNENKSCEVTDIFEEA